MSCGKQLVSIALTLFAFLAVTAPVTAAESPPHYSIAPGQVKVFMCGWGYGPIARQHALHSSEGPLEVRRVSTSLTGGRVVFTHKVSVREDLGRYRTIINRGHQTIDYRDRCPWGSGSSSRTRR
jgi:hypothetical protein